jgi:hypothetical protein
MKPSMEPSCGLCLDTAWICTQHRDRPWPHDDECSGPGLLCTNPRCVAARVFRAVLSARRSDRHSDGQGSW